MTGGAGFRNRSVVSSAAESPLLRILQARIANRYPLTFAGLPLRERRGAVGELRRGDGGRCRRGAASHPCASRCRCVGCPYRVTSGRGRIQVDGGVELQRSLLPVGGKRHLFACYRDNFRQSSSRRLLMASSAFHN